MSNFAIINGVSTIAEMPTDSGYFAESVLATMTARSGDFAERTTKFFDNRRRSREESGHADSKTD